MFLLNNPVVGSAADGFCANTADIWQLVGVFLLVFKIVIPIILIIFGMIDLGKAVISSDDKAVTKATKSLMMRAISAVVIFFVPTLVGLIFSLIGTFNSDVKADFEVCRKCITKPNQDGDIEGSCNYHINAKS
ncbi:MAG: hypothetical protein K2M17_04005 [Bacilli bacterium]|nr:hypothetical protein [Bacilli bacterium]